MLVRLVPIRAGKPNRFAFRNIWLDSREPEKVRLGPFSSSEEAWFEATNDRVTLRPMKGEVEVNGEPVHGPRHRVLHPLLRRDTGDPPRPLAHGDLVALTEVGLHGLNREWVYEFEEDLRLVKRTRWQEEAARGIHRSPPDERLLCRREIGPRFTITVDETGITAGFTKADLVHLMEVLTQLGSKHPRGSEPETYWALRWEELDAIEFSPEKHIYSGGDVLKAAGSGWSEVGKADGFTRADLAESDAEATFHAPYYSVKFQWRGKVVATLSGIEAESCEVLANAIEYHAPIDLTLLGHGEGAH